VFEIGASLREARSRQGLSFDDMEARTKVRAKYLRFLEEERFDQLPGDTYTKGFLRVYANALGLEGQLYVDEFNTRFLAGEEDAPPRPRRVQPTRHRRQARRESHLFLGVLAAMAVITALVIAAWRFGGTDSPSVHGLDREGRVSAPVQRITLDIRAVNGRSFLQVWRGSGGRQLYAGTLEEGQMQRFTSTKLLLSIGTPRNVVVKINGNRYPASSKPVPKTLEVSAASG
jgi:hypothetical protein